MTNRITLIVTFFVFIILSSLSNCDPGIHKPSEHPCDFPDIWTEVNLLSPLSYKIIDKETFENLVDTTLNARIHADSVILMDDNFQRLPFSYNSEQAYEYYIDNWIFDNFFLYNGMPVPGNDPEAYLNLKTRTFYLRTAYNDVDTIIIHFEKCLANSFSFNGHDVIKPIGERYDGSASLYFKK